MTEYSLYFDDSGHPDDQPYVAVAGYAATEAEWIVFEQEWNQVLSKYDLGTPFHMTDFMKSRRFSALKRDQILLALSSVVKSNTTRPFVCGIDVAAWKRVNDEFAFEECHGAPYAIAMRSIAKQINTWKTERLSVDDRLLVFVEQGTKHHGQMEEVFKRDSLPVPNKVPKEIPQVQPCDILAWETFQYLRSGNPKRLGKNLDRLIRHMRKQDGFLAESCWRPTSAVSAKIRACTNDQN